MARRIRNDCRIGSLEKNWVWRVFLEIKMEEILVPTKSWEL